MNRIPRPHISRDREGKIEPGHWRYTAEGMPGGVMLQIGLHYVDVLMMLLGPVASVSGMASQLVLPGDNPDVGTLLMKHENGAISSLGRRHGVETPVNDLITTCLTLSHRRAVAENG